MDVAVDHDGKGMLAVTVRQFAASRIEKQLLTQVFELLCNPPSSVDYSKPALPEATSARSGKQISSEQDQGKNSFARRRAA